MKNILIIGAGAVGQVYGYQFAQAGNAVSFFVKEKYRSDLEKGLTLYNLNQDKKKKRPIHFTDFSILTDWDSAANHQQPWDQIYLCISSTALLNFDFDGLKKAVSQSTTVVLLQPGPDDYQLAIKHIAKEQLVQGMITLISYAAPLPTETVPEPGITYWLPPMAATPFAGNPKRRGDIVDTFKRASMNANAKPNLRDMAPYPTAALMAFLTALEASDWQFDKLEHNVSLQKAMFKAQKQAFKAISEKTHTKPPLWQHALSPWLLKILFKVAPKVVPLDLETYFQVHFTKVKDQTKLFMRTYIEAASQYGVEATELIELNQMTN